MSSDAVIQVHGLGKRYRTYKRPSDRLLELIAGRWTGHSWGEDFWAIRHVSFEVPRGGMLGIIGGNGSGKSTLLQCLAGTVQPTEGTMSIGGRVAALLELGSGFNPDFSGSENIRLYAMVLGLTPSEIDARYDAIVDFADIGKHIDQPVKTYSSGMAVRLAFAVAAHIDPDVLIVDEALAVGDISFQQKCYRRFQQIRDRGTTVLYVSHDLSSIAQFCTAVMVMDRGRVFDRGEPSEMVDRYKMLMADRASPLRDRVSKEAVAPAIGRLRDRHPPHGGMIDYGDRSAEIIDYGLIDRSGLPVAVVTGGDVEIVMRLRFHHRCENPIAAFTVKDIKGNEIFGTNTWYADRPIGSREAGAEFVVRFRTAVPLAPGGYSLSLGCTELVDGGLAVHHRIYDAILFEVVSERRFVGVFDPGIDISITDCRL